MATFGAEREKTIILFISQSYIIATVGRPRVAGISKDEFAFKYHINVITI